MPSQINAKHLSDHHAARWATDGACCASTGSSAISAMPKKDAAAVIQLDPNYAPTYVELGLAYEADRNFTRAAEAYDTYLLLAPNFTDSAAVRARVAKLRGQR